MESPGLTQISKARLLCGRLTNTVKMVWRITTMRGRKWNGKERVKSFLTTNCSARLLTRMISSRVQLEIVTLFRPYQLSLRGLSACVLYFITNRQTLQVATWSNSTSTVFLLESWLMISFWLTNGQDLNFQSAWMASFGFRLLKKRGLSFWDHIHELLEHSVHSPRCIFYQVPPRIG